MLEHYLRCLLFGCCLQIDLAVDLDWTLHKTFEIVLEVVPDLDLDLGVALVLVLEVDLDLGYLSYYWYLSCYYLRC